MTGEQWKTFYYIKESYVPPTTINVENLEQEYTKIMVLWDGIPHRVEDTLFQRNILHTATFKIERAEPLTW
jgi:hypothetical protein